MLAGSCRENSRGVNFSVLTLVVYRYSTIGNNTADLRLFLRPVVYCLQKADVFSLLQTTSVSSFKTFIYFYVISKEGPREPGLVMNFISPCELCTSPARFNEAILDFNIESLIPVFCFISS